MLKRLSAWLLRQAYAYPYPRWVWALVLLCCICLMGLAWLDRTFPLPLPGDRAGGALLVLARDGTPLRAFPERAHIWRHPVQLEQVDQRYLEALIHYEDRYFYWHPGINPLALARAGWQWWRQGHIVSGGSTLTMQLARMLEPMPRSGAGKVRQMLRALQLEWHLSKAEILTLYINHAPMGGVLEGVEAASRAYLGKPAQSLSHAEAALLAVLPQAPSRYRPDRHPHRARAARDKVLSRLAGRWPAAVISDALHEPPYAQTLRAPLLAPLLAQRLKTMRDAQQLRQADVAPAASRVRKPPQTGRLDTFIDARAQERLEALLLDRSRNLPARVSMAALVLDNASLEVRAYAGSADFGDEQRFSHVDMVRASRSPGSTLKPFLYGLALDEGLIHSESLLADVPQSFSGYQPGNFQQAFHGPVSASEALVKSLNVPAVEVLERLGPAHFVALLRRGGLKLDLPQGSTPNLSVILGGAGTSLEQLVGAYRALAAGGLAGRPRLTPDEPLQEQRLLSAGAAFIIRDLLESGGPMGRALEWGAGQKRGIAWKTGTSFGFRDAWSIGVSARYTIGVWVGRPDGTPNPGFFGANIAAPLLLDLFAALETGQAAPRTPPPTVAQVRICWPLGTAAAQTPVPLCHQSRLAWTLEGVAPPTFPDRLRAGEARYRVALDPVSGARVQPGCFSGPLLWRDMARWPALLEPWLGAELRQKTLAPEWLPACSTQARPEAGLRIVGISAGAVLRRSAAAMAPLLRLELRGTSAGEVIWLVNGRHMARQPAQAPYIQRLETPGRYDVTAMDNQGRYDRVSFSLR